MIGLPYREICVGGSGKVGVVDVGEIVVVSGVAVVVGSVAAGEVDVGCVAVGSVAVAVGVAVGGEGNSNVACVGRLAETMSALGVATRCLRFLLTLPWSVFTM